MDGAWISRDFLKYKSLDNIKIPPFTSLINKLLHIWYIPFLIVLVSGFLLTHNWKKPSADHHVYTPIQVKAERIYCEIPFPPEYVEDSWDSISEYRIIYPRVAFTSRPAVEKEINRIIKDAFIPYEAILETIEESTWLGTIDADFDVVYQSGNVLCIRIVIDWYGDRAAHANRTVTVFNFDLQSGKLIRWDDFFKIESKESMIGLMQNKLLTNECNCIFEFMPVKYDSDRSFYIKNNSVVVLFNTYEVACGMCGPVEIVLSANEIKGFVKASCPLTTQLCY